MRLAPAAIRQPGHLRGDTAAGHSHGARRIGYGTPIAVFVVLHALLLAIAWRAPELIGTVSRSGSAPVLPHAAAAAPLWDWISPWFRFDTWWYVDVASHGYRWGVPGKANTNFMPVYPLLIAGASRVTGLSPWYSAWLIATVSYLGAIAALWRWACRKLEGAAPGRVLLLVACFPFAFFFITPYAEPLFLLLAVSAFMFAEDDRWVLAGLCAALSTVTRPVGVAVVAGVVLLAWSHGRRREAVSCTLALLPLAAFAAYLGITFGHPLAFLTYHSAGWVPARSEILTTLAAQFHTNLTPFDRVDALLAALFLGSGILVWRRIGPGYGAYVILGTLMPLVHGLVSMERYVIVLFPVMALWGTWENRAGQVALFAGSLLGLLAATTLFAAGYAIF